MLLTWAPDVLRAAGLTVVETPGWQTRSHGEFPASIAGYWHHDASPPGDSPGALDWMVNNWANASANFRVTRHGVWQCVGAGVAYHAGSTQVGHPANWNSFGVETDQTVNETPSPVMLDSTRAGFAALFKHMGRGADSLYFHKTSAYPLGRKVDPWFDAGSNDKANWPAELARERALVQQLINGPSVASVVDNRPTPPPLAPPYPGRVLRQGAKGADVKIAQLGLNRHSANLGITPLKADGDFGPATDRMLRAYQRARSGAPFRLAADGAIGPRTWPTFWQ